MSAPLNTALKFCFPIRKMSDGTRFQPSPAPTVDAALYPDGSAMAGVVLTWDATNLEYTYTLASGNVTLTGPYRISILVTDAAAASIAYQAEWEVEAVPTSVTAVQVRTEMDANSTRLAEIATDVDGIAAIPTNPLLTTDSRLNNLDATISSRSTLTAAQVWAYGTRTLTSVVFGTDVTLTSSINSTGDIEAIYQGSDYYSAENNALVWVLTNPPSLVGATAVFNVAGQTFAATINTVTNTITVELPRAKTALMTLGRDKYGLIITFASTHRTVKVIGYATVYPEPS